VKTVRIATRKSPLALWQAEHVASLIRQLDPSVGVSLVRITTEGDRFLQGSLAAVGGKGLFIKDIEAAILGGRADLAVHSLKDMTAQIPAELCLAAIPRREDPHDAFVGLGYQKLDSLPSGARIGTSSLRRTCQLLERFPYLEIVPLRGNVQTRIRRAKEMGLAGVVLALAGLRRLGLESEVTEILPFDVSLPAVGQGALALECANAASGLRALLRPLDDRDSAVAVSAERAFLARLEGGCSFPIAAHAVVEGARLSIRGLVGSTDGRAVLRAERTGPADAAEAVGAQLAEAVLAAGGTKILRESKKPK
jgi:hydroxymethylbilane synthase